MDLHSSGKHYLGITLSSKSMISLLQTNKNIESVDLDNTHKTLGIRNMDFNFDKNRLKEEMIPWGIKAVLQDLDYWNEVNNATLDEISPIKVCVADTGYDLGHEDLPKEPNVDGVDGYGEDWSYDGNSHGTHCSGTIAALGDNNKGVVGIIPSDLEGNFQILAGKALGSSGVGSSSGVMAAVQGCVDLGANVVSLSLGSSSYSGTEDKFYQEIYESDGVLLIAAAGNSGDGATSYPASYSSLVSVAALESDYDIAYYSQYNAQVEITGPGTDVRSTVPDDKYAYYSGTSMATPHVAGVAGLIWMHYGDCTNVQIRHVLLKSAMSLTQGGIKCDSHSGFGLVQAKAALEYLDEHGCESNASEEVVGGCCEGIDDTHVCVSVVINANLFFTSMEYFIRDAETKEVTYMSEIYDNSDHRDIVTSSGALKAGESFMFELKTQNGSFGSGAFTVSVNNEVVLEGTVKDGAYEEFST